MKIFDREWTRAKEYTHGTHRTRPPAETIADFGRDLSIFGITRLANITGLDNIGLPVWLAVRPNARALSVSQGKGIDDDSARASALMESIETWHAERVELPLRYQSPATLAAEAAIIDLDGLHRAGSGELRRDAPILWVSGWDLLEGRSVFVPFDCVTANFVEHHAPLFRVGTNGLASGNHLLEAAVHGLCEVIERDAIALWQLEPAPVSRRRRVALDSIGGANCRAVLGRLSDAQVACAVWDVTSDIGIPTFATIIYEHGDRPGWRALGSFSGFGCHLDPEVALMRALTEAIQSRGAMIAGSRDDMFPRHYAHNTDPVRQAELVVALEAEAPTRRFGDRASVATDSFEGDLMICLERLRAVGRKSAVLVDLTRPELAIPVVKVLVPGLEGASVNVDDYVPGERARAYREALA